MTAAGNTLRNAYRLQTLEAALHVQQIPEVITILRAAGIEPILAKGWALASLYPDPTLRPYGDIDLCVPPSQYELARRVVQDHVASEVVVDLHSGLPDLDDRSLDALYARSRVIRLGPAEVRVLGYEDHLRFLCLHFVRHGARRPLWLCDIALLLESRRGAFDWAYCLSGDRRRSLAVGCVVGLGAALLDAKLDMPCFLEARCPLPAWLVPAVVSQ